VKTILRYSLLYVIAGILSLSNVSHGIAAQAQSQTTTSTSKKSASATAPTAQEIADAKSKNLVWVNTTTRVYHNASSSFYGSTKRGKFMTEDDAKKAGYRAASESTGGNKKASPASR
jgi:BRCT domain type II-containing protein